MVLICMDSGDAIAMNGNIITFQHEFSLYSGTDGANVDVVESMRMRCGAGVDDEGLLSMKCEANVGLISMLCGTTLYDVGLLCNPM